MAETVRLHKAFSLVQERLTKLFDESGVKRSFTVPYVDGEPADAHVAAEAGGDIATACVTPDTSIALADGASKKASDIKPGDVLYGIDGDVRVRHVETSVQPAVEITLNDGTTIVVSESHTFSLPSGGYVEAGEAHGQTLRILAGPAQVKSVARIGMQPVIRLRVGGSHTYLSNGIWSLE